MVGAHFESLLPTLATFGRNKQLAWMMWHSTADVKLPDIQRVLEGVPEDLAHVIQRLIAKDQSQRYRSATKPSATSKRAARWSTVCPTPPTRRPKRRPPPQCGARSGLSNS